MHDNFSASDGAIILFLASILLYHMFRRKSKSQKINNLQATVESDRRTVLQNDLRERETRLRNIIVILSGALLAILFVILCHFYK